MLKRNQNKPLYSYQPAISYRDNGSLVVTEPRSPLEGNVRSSARYGIYSRSTKRKMSASNVGGRYVVNGTGALNKGVLFVTPTDTFDAREFPIDTRIISRIALIF
jgi:hypothetical protein